MPSPFDPLLTRLRMLLLRTRPAQIPAPGGVAPPPPVRVPTTVTFTPAASFTPTAGGAAFPVTAAVLDQYGTEIVTASGAWTSGNRAVASLTQSGRVATVTPVAAGQAVLAFATPRAGQPDLVATVQVGVAAAGGTTGTFFGAALPAARYAAFKAWVNARPDLTAIPAGRRFAPAAMTSAALQAALDAACAATGGHRMVVLPDNWTAKVALTLAANAEPATDVILTSAWYLANLTTYQRGVRVPYAKPPAVPLLETAPLTADLDGPILVVPPGGGASRRQGFRTYGVELRTAADMPSGRACRYLVSIGWTGAPGADEASQPTRILIGHCWDGGHNFDPAGVWRQNGLSWGYYDASAGFALVDGQNREHGGVNWNAVNNGLYQGLENAGPYVVENMGSDRGGSIVITSGGGPMAAAGPEPADGVVRLNDILRHERYNPASVNALRDAQGQTCPWLHKGQVETKRASRLLIEYNNFRGSWYSVDQAWVIAIKSAEDGPKYTGTQDVVVRWNNIYSQTGGIAETSEGASSGSQTASLRRFVVHENVIEATATWLILSSTRSPTEVSTLPRDFVITGNLCVRPGNTDWGGKGVETGITAAVTDAQQFAGVFRFARNIFGKCDYRFQNDSGGNTFAMGGAFPAGGFVDGPPDITGNWIVTGGLGTGGDAPYDVAQRYVTNNSDLGLTFNNGWRYAATSPLLTGGPAGVRVGPDLDLLAAVYAAVLAGDVRAYL